MSGIGFLNTREFLVEFDDVETNTRGRVVRLPDLSPNYRDKLGCKLDRAHPLEMDFSNHSGERLEDDTLEKRINAGREKVHLSRD
ncbi:hypothetical protein ACLOJK_018315 [Asimina triloba]